MSATGTRGAARNPARDQVAIVGIGRSPYSRDRAGCTPGSLVLDACIAAARDAGLGATDIDGICGSMVAAQYVQAALGIPAVSWFANPQAVIGNQLVAAVAAVHSGMCDVALVYHHAYRLPWASRSAAQDPMRRRATLGVADARSWYGTGHVDTGPNSMFGANAYAAWAGRYLHDHGYTREALGRVALNSRTNAAANPNAVYREPLTMDAYLAGRMVRDPLSVYDMDIPVDAADAFIVTTTERARDLPRPPVLVHAATLGHTDYGSEEQLRDLDHAGQVVVTRKLWAKSELTLADVDVFFPYEGFSNIALAWFENVGYCGRGEGGAFVAQHWVEAEQRIVIDGRIPVNTHGGSLSEGGTQGAGHLYEACLQLRGEAGPRQVPGAEVALVTPGGYYFNSQGFLLRADR
ncbi:MAG: thiolase family protein [Acidimicrobiales bacterium]|nr:thiolase family protein [Acidimicrobiales bacterium]